MEAARISTGDMSQISIYKILIKVDWERLEWRRIWHKLIMLYKITKNLVPTYFTYANLQLPATVHYQTLIIKVPR